jgi:uncharacterized membrane protein YqiK
MSQTTLLLIATLAVVNMLVTVVCLVKFYRRISPHQALVVNGPQGVRVLIGRGALVLPVLHRAEVVDLSTHALTLALTGAQSLHCKDNLRADLRARFLIRVSPTAEDVERVALSVGAARAASPDTLRELFEAKFREALRTVIRSADFEDWRSHQEEFRDQVLRVVGRDLMGFVLEDLQLEEFSETPLSFYDVTNILDAHGVRLITERTLQARIATNELEQQARLEMTRRQVEADQAHYAAEAEKALREARKQPGFSQAAFDAKLEAMKAKVAERQAAILRELEAAHAEGRASTESTGGGAAGGPSAAGLQAGLRKT